MSLYSEEAENALVARLVLDPTQLAIIGDKLSPADLYVEDNRVAYQAMLSLQKKGKPIDLMTIRQEAERPKLQLPVLDFRMGMGAPLDTYAGIISNYAFRRRVLAMAENLAEKAQEEDDPNEILQVVQTSYTELVRGVETGNLVTPERAVDEYLANLEERMKRGGGLSFGIPKVDDLILPAQPGDFIILAARPSVGKTALAEIVAERWAQQAAPKPVLFVSAEMKTTALFDRIAARSGKVPAVKLRKGQLTAEEIEAVRAVMEERRHLGVWYLDQPRATTASIRTAAAKARMLTGGLGLAAIIVDYLQLLKDSDGGDNEAIRVARISNNLKAIAREFDCPALVCAQLNRNLAREKRAPRLDDLSWSGAIEQDADVVILLDRQLESPNLDLYVAKQRQYKVGKVELLFRPEDLYLVEEG